MRFIPLAGGGSVFPIAMRSIGSRVSGAEALLGHITTVGWRLMSHPTRTPTGNCHPIKTLCIAQMVRATRSLIQAM